MTEPSPSPHSTITHSPIQRLPSASSLVRSRVPCCPSWILLVQLFIGLGWARAAVEKLINPHWWDGTVLGSFAESHLATALPWYRPFLDHVVSPNPRVIALVVVVAQLLIALSLISGRHLVTGLAVGMFLNLNFVAAGAINPSIFYLISQAVVLLWALNLADQPAREASRFGPLAFLALLLTLVDVPFISTLKPSMVIDDPALILAFFGVLLALTSELERRNLTQQPVVN